MQYPFSSVNREWGNMAKRFTDTDKWKKEWFQSLSPKMKCAWIYILDNCDHAGVWSINEKLLSFQVGQRITIKEILSHFGDKVRLIDNKLIIDEFVSFQYGKLDPFKNNVHASVFNILENLKNPTPHEGFTNPLRGDQDKDKDKEKDKDKDKDKDKEKEKDIVTPQKTKPQFDFVALYAKYPRKEGKSGGFRIFLRDVKTAEDFQSLDRALDRYIEMLRREKTEAQYIMHFSTFMGRWRDFLDPDFGTSASFAEPEKKSRSMAEILAAERAEKSSQPQKPSWL